jgi:putative pyoverdin transport system ATP-binding/permease protein
MTSSTKKVSITTLLYQHSPKLLIFAVVIGAVAGALYSLIIPFVLKGLEGQVNAQVSGVASAHQGGMLLFFGVCLLIMLAKVLSVILVNNIAKSATAELRVSIAKKINSMMIDNVESIGFPRLLNILTDDVNRVAAASVAIPMILVSTVTVIGMLAYLASLKLAVFVLVLVAIMVGVAIFQIPVSIASRLYTSARGLRDVVQEGVRGLVMGVYELKLSKDKSVTYMNEELIAPQQQSVRMEKIGDALIHLGGTASDMLAFFIIGIVVFLVPDYISFPASEKYGVVMALLYIAGPVSMILGMMQQLTMGRVSIARIHSLDAYPEDVPAGDCTAPTKPWREFRLQSASYQYASQDPDRAFALSPIDLSFQPGQINFIVGGNGSGKSTLSKLISLHYLPASGGVYLDDELIDAGNIARARSRISVIFSNYYLFGKLYRQYTSVDEAKINSWLEALGLKGKTEFVDGKFTTTKLSDGQRRRLALLVALLEDKDIYIFDEWAADQDPGFKRVFYQDVLQDMKSKNKLVIVITHDDRYFECADRVVFMEDGKVIGVKENDHQEASSSSTSRKATSFSPGGLSISG